MYINTIDCINPDTGDTPCCIDFKTDTNVHISIYSSRCYTVSPSIQSIHLAVSVCIGFDTVYYYDI